jgi:hypothetical protein
MVHLIPMRGGLACAIDEDVFETSLTVELPDDIFWTGRPCDYSWQPLIGAKTIYARINLTVNNKQRPIEVLLHRLVMQARRGQFVDHIDRNGLNNQSDNLRFCTASENQAYKQVVRNRSGFRGVSRYGASKWRARLVKGGVSVEVGVFDSAEEAARAHDAKAIELHGEFAFINFPSP